MDSHFSRAPPLDRRMWTHISHVLPHSISETRFYCGEKIIFGKVGVATYFILF